MKEKSLLKRICKSLIEINRENKTLLFFIFTSFILTIFFLSMNFTGAVVGTTKNDFSILGILFFVGGLIVTYVYARSKR